MTQHRVRGGVVKTWCCVTSQTVQTSLCMPLEVLCQCNDHFVFVLQERSRPMQQGTRVWWQQGPQRWMIVQMQSLAQGVLVWEGTGHVARSPSSPAPSYLRGHCPALYPPPPHPPSPCPGRHPSHSKGHHHWSEQGQGSSHPSPLPPSTGGAVSRGVVSVPLRLQRPGLLQPPPRVSCSQLRCMQPTQWGHSGERQQRCASTSRVQ
jgi:hypothetical protein